MDIRDEKCHVYEQLKLLMEERRELSRQYYDLKEYLIHLEEDKIVSDSSDELSQETKFSNFKSEKSASGLFNSAKNDWHSSTKLQRLWVYYCIDFKRVRKTFVR